jgi:hypothetical protein
MQCSVELPIKYLKNYSKYFDFDFIIASTCLEYPEYLDYFCARKKKRFTILDNGAFETGEAIPDEKYLELALKLQPDVLIIPDVFNNTSATLARFHSFMTNHYCSKVYYGAKIQLMGVLQAQGSVDNAELLAQEYTISSNSIDWIGIPYIAGLDRYQLIKRHPEWKNVHILGLPHLVEVKMLQELLNVKSIDTSLPVKICKEKEYLHSSFNSQEIVHPTDTNLGRDRLKWNLQYFTAMCHNTIQFGDFYSCN